jgi:hypothetical protein
MRGLTVSIVQHKDSIADLRHESRDAFICSRTAILQTDLPFLADDDVAFHGPVDD